MAGEISAMQTQFNAWLEEATGKMEKLGTSFQGLDEQVKKGLLDHTREIAKLSDEVAATKRDSTARFRELVAQDRAGGAYRGKYANREQARLAGLMVIAALASAAESERKTALAELEKAGVSPGTGAGGGYLMPEQLVDGIIRNVEQYGVLPRVAKAFTAPVMTGKIPVRSGGLTVYYPDLEVAATASAPTFGAAAFSLIRNSTLVLVDRWMLQSQLAVPLGELLAEEAGYALAYATDLNGFMGDGTSAYARITGVFKRAATANLTYTGADPAASDDPETFAKVYAKGAYYLGQLMATVPAWVHFADPRFFLHLKAFFGFLGALDSNNRPVADILAADRPMPFRLMGYPAEITQVAPSTTAVSTKFVTFGALNRGVAIVRHTSGVEIRQSEHYKFAEGQIAIATDMLQDIVELDPNAYARLATAAS